ncbi:hypothetical protein ACQ4LE_009441 [Meloidogyne hapla]
MPAKRTALDANMSPLSGNGDVDNSSKSIKLNSLNLLIDCQVNFVKTTLTSINAFIPTLTPDQTPLLQTLMQTLTSQFDLLAKSIETLKEEKQQNFIS